MTDGDLDDLIRNAAKAEALQTGALERAVRQRLRSRRWPSYLAVGAVAAALLLAFWLTRIPREFRDAARDHSIEVVQHRPRHWKTTPAELTTIENQHQVAVPAGYRLKEAKTCGIAGKPVLHMVYTDGVREVSLYLTEGQSNGTAQIDGQQVQAFHTNSAKGLIVGPPAECRQFADVIQRS